MRKLIAVALLICVTGCAKNIPSQSNKICAAQCDFIYGRANDWKVISDDLVRNIYQHNRLCEELNK